MSTVCGVSTSDDDNLQGSDDDNAQYNPVVLKTIKSGIDTVTSIAFGINSNIGYYSLVCYSNQQLSAFTQNGDFMRNIVFSSFHACAGYHIHDMAWFQQFTEDNSKDGMYLLVLKSAATSSYFHFLYFKTKAFSQNLKKSSIIEDSDFEIKAKYIESCLATGICVLEYTDRKLKIAICCVDRQTYRIFPSSRRFIGIFKITKQNEFKRISSIEFKDLDKTGRFFTYPKKLAKSSIGDLWVIDRKSSKTGDVKVFRISEHYRTSTFLFTYSGSGKPGFKFDPMDVKASQDVMVISDCRNHNVHLVKNNGIFLMHVMDAEQGLQYPRALCVDVFDRVWVGCNDGTVHILKYRTKFEA